MSSRSDECCVIDELLEPWADGELEPTVRARLEDHLERCPECRRAAARARAVIAGLRALPELVPPAAVLAKLPRSAPRHVARAGWWRGAAAAAVVALALGGGLVWHQERLEAGRVATATREARYALAVVARASAAAGHEVAAGLAVGRIVRAADRPAVRALTTTTGTGG